MTAIAKSAKTHSAAKKMLWLGRTCYQVSRKKVHLTERLISNQNLLNGWTDFKYQYVKLKRITAQTFWPI